MPTGQYQHQKGKGQGFASMTEEKRKAIASKGGIKAWANGTAHKWTKEEAQAAGRIGGKMKMGKTKQQPQPAGEQAA